FAPRAAGKRRAGYILKRPGVRISASPVCSFFLPCDSGASPRAAARCGRGPPPAAPRSRPARQGSGAAAPPRPRCPRPQTVHAAPGTYPLRVVALDTAGRPGAAEETIEAGLTTVGPLSLGSLMLGVSRPEGMRLQLEFGSEPTAIASFDIYGGAPGLRMSATLEVARDPDGPALVTLPLAMKRADDTRVVATGAAPVGALPPGDYVVRGIIKLDDGTTGRVMR